MSMQGMPLTKWMRILNAVVLGATFWACTGKNTAGTSEESEGLYAVKDLEVAGVTQKGPFVKGSAVTVRGIDCQTMKLSDEIFEGTVKSDKGDFDIDGINLKSSCAIFEVTGYYLDEVSGRQSAEAVTLRALTDLSDRKRVNVNMLTRLEYDRVVKLVSKNNVPFAQAKKRAEKEVLMAFGVDGDVPASEDLNILESGAGNAALLAVSVLVQVAEDYDESMSVAERVDYLSAALAEDGAWNDEMKPDMAAMASAAMTNGLMDSVRKNLESWGASEVSDFEKYVEEFVEVNSAASSLSIDWSISKEAHFNPSIEYDSITDGRDGQVYRTIQIGSQTWMAENLNYADSVATPSLLERSWCHENKPERCAVAGRLYTWAAAVDSVKLASDTDNPQSCGYLKACNLEKVRGICPEGWHLPDTTEWQTLVNTVAGGDMAVAGIALASNVGWYDEDKGPDNYGFSAFPAGDKYRDTDSFDENNRSFFFWSASESQSDRQLSYVFGSFVGSAGFAGYFKDSGYPVRCLKDE